MNVKRGMFCVLIVLFLVLFSSSALAVTYEILEWAGQCDDPNECAGVLDIRDGVHVEFDGFTAHDDECTANDDRERPREFPLSISQGSVGCYIQLSEIDGFSDLNDCGWIAIAPGKILGSDAQRGVTTNVHVTRGFDGSDVAEFIDAGKILKVSSGRELICNSDERWYQCDELVLSSTTNLPQIVNIGEKTYVCIGPVNNQYLWEDLSNLQTDADTDGVPDIPVLDCDATRNDVHGSFSLKGCVILGEGQTLQPGQVECVQAALESCNDNLDNDCDGIVDNCGKDRATCLANQLSWLDGGTTNNCCGDNPSEDVSTIVVNGARETIPGDYACLTTTSTLVASEGSPKDHVGSSHWGGADAPCQGEWCWVEAAEAAFHIYTIKKALGTFDIVSNTQDWIQCSAASQGYTSFVPNNLDLVYKPIANQFYCYEEGNKWSFAQCDASAGQINNGIKMRNAGDGLFKLELLPPLPILEGTDKPSAFSVDVAKYLSFYGGTGIYSAGYDQLEFTLKFTSSITPPADVIVRIIHDTANTFEFNALAYATNAQSLEEGKSIHVRIPINGNLFDTQSIFIETLVPLNTIEVSNVYFSRSGQNTPICSGRTDRATNAWLDDFDFWTAASSINGMEMCNKVFGTGSWIGGAGIQNGQQRCCGDDSNEYYAGGAEGRGCWNSLPVISGDAITNIEADVTFQENDIQRQTNLNLPCASSECLFALPGRPPYTITNLHRGLYDLSFVSATSEMSILRQGSFLTEGNIRVKKVPLQVLHVNEVDADGNLDQGFYGCNAADYLVSAETGVIDEPYCSIHDGKFCSYSTLENGITTISAWSDEALTEVTGVKVGAEDTLQLINLLQKGLFSDPNRESFLPRERIQPSSIVPGRNVLPNPEFIPTAGDVLGWEIPGINTNLERRYIDDHTTNGMLTIGAGDRIRSEKIAVKPNMLMEFSQDAVCSNMIVYLFNNNGDVTLVSWPETDFEVVRTQSSIISIFSGTSAPSSSSQLTVQEQPQVALPQMMVQSELPRIFTGSDTTHFVVEFIGRSAGLTVTGFSEDCRIARPFLQLIGEGIFATRFPTFTPVTEFTTSLYPEKPRSAAACCPANYCWNGYSCVEPMGQYTSAAIVEHVADDMDYRCVDGQWTAQSVKTNWQGDDSGFCPQASQCFITQSTTQGADPSATAADFYDGNYPPCINSGEYVFDNYCRNGEWTSRTKFLAAQLLATAERRFLSIPANGDYTLYCTSFDKALVDLNGQEAILEGTGFTSVPSANPGQQQSQTPSQRICFGNVDGNILSPEQNTCINNVCILKFQEGLFPRRERVVFATSLNKEPQDANSFLSALGIPAQDLKQLCPGNKFTNCPQQLPGDFYYDAELNAIIYGKEGVTLGSGILPSAVDTVLSAVQNLFTEQSSLSSQQDFISEARNFREMYMLKDGDKQVRAVKEVGEGKKTLVAEYENFDTPICDYVHIQRIGNTKLQEESQAALGQPVLSCTNTGAIQRVESVGGLEFLWPQLTGKLRSER